MALTYAYRVGMQARIKFWIAVWVALGIISVLSYPTGQSSLIFGFWPSNHFIPWLITFLCLVLGGIFAWDMFYNYYPQFDADIIEEIESGVEPVAKTDQPTVTADDGEK